ncbi:hypothetical protein HDK77DRAFT_101332 [Phyllosticta capitalensis]
MGLAAPKNRIKISADPNNTTWSKNTDRFGHKILTKQGWTPGEYLGAKDANHSGHYTAANASHIRVKVKDDTLGLGRKRGGAENDNFGLSLFQGVLGRLNGKSDAELKTETEARKRLESKLYGGTGTVFVFGGYLVGDKIEDLQKKSGDDKTTASEAGEASKSEKKRKRSGDNDEEAPKLKKKTRKSDLKAEFSASSPDESEEESKKKSKSKKSKKSKDKAQLSESDNASSTEAQKDESSKDDKKARKEAKKAAKAERRAKKEAKRLKKEKRKQEKAKEEESDSSSSSESEADATVEAAKKEGVAFAGNRLAVRQRYIRQKKMASMDTQALKEIFMVKGQA